jgi:hypothetical protein
VVVVVWTEWFSALIPASVSLESFAVLCFGPVRWDEFPLVRVGAVFLSLGLVQPFHNQELGPCGCGIDKCLGTQLFLVESDARFVGLWKEVKEVEGGEGGVGRGEWCSGARVLRGWSGSGAWAMLGGHRAGV